MMIAFPPCTHLAVSGARWFKEKQRDGRQQKAIDFFMNLVNADIGKIVIENPIGIMSTKYRKPDQIIQPWQFGHGETKATCLWLKNLPLLEPTNIVEGRENRIHKMPPGKNRSKLRSLTYRGIAEAGDNMKKDRISLTKFYRICEMCEREQATQHHEKFPATKPNIKHYGQLIFAPFNTAALCAKCNVGHNNIYTEDRRFNWNEQEFREAAKKAGHKLPPVMKSNQFKEFE